MKTHLFLAIALLLVAAPLTAQDNKASVSLSAAIYEEEVSGNLDKAVELYLNILKKYPDDRQVAAKTLYHLGLVNEKMGKQKANEYFTRLVNTYPDQTEMVTLAKARLSALGGLADADAVRERQLDWYCGMPTADGRTVLCSSALKLVVRDLVSGQERIVAKGNPEEGLYLDCGLISPDGKKVAYILLRSTCPSQIRVVGTDGSQDRLLSDQTDEPDGFGTLRVQLDDWSPDSRQVLAWVNRKEQKGSQRTLLSVNDGTARVLSTFVGAGRLSWGESSPRARFSPDGKHIAYEIETASVQSKRIFAIPVQGGEPQLLVDHPSDNELVGWTPEGRLVFLSDRSGTRALWTLRVRDGKADGEPEAVRRDIGSSTPEGIDRNGAYYYRLQTESREVYRATLDPSSGTVVSGPSPVSLRYVGLSFWPAYSRDGRFLAYFSGPSHNIHIRNLATGEERELKSSMSYIYYQSLAWHPDGSALLIRGMRVGDIVIGLHRLNVTTGEITPVLLAKGGGAYYAWAENPSFSPDGRYIYFRTYEADSTGVAAYRISRLDLQTGGQEDVFLPTLPAEVRLFALSPDGTRIVFGARSGKLDYIGVVPVAGGEFKVIYEYPAGEYIRGFSGLIWTADGKGVLYHRIRIGHDANHPADDFWLMSADGGSPRKLLSLTGVIMSLTVHPNGREIAFSANESVWEFRVLENLFPPKRVAK